jgi:hypothetical protein
MATQPNETRSGCDADLLAQRSPLHARRACVLIGGQLNLMKKARQIAVLFLLKKMTNAKRKKGKIQNA